MAGRVRDGMIRDMGLLSRLSRPRESHVTLSALELPGGAFLPIVGESYRQPALEQTAKLATKGVPPFPVTVELRGSKKQDIWFQALLVREPNNPHDKNAIMVYSTAGHIGYLSREDAQLYQYTLKTVEGLGSRAGACSACMHRAKNGMWGVTLALSSPGECLDELNE